jgi:hypothetical protein
MEISQKIKLKIFTDKSFLLDIKQYVPLLYPFWGSIPEDEGDKDSGRFDEYCRLGKQYILPVSSMEESDVAVLPFEWKSKSQWKLKYKTYLDFANQLSREAGDRGKRLIIFFNNDSDENVPVENSIILRTSFYRSTRLPNEFAVPGWSVDFLHRYLGGKLPVRKKPESPVVGYCGYLDRLGLPESKIMIQAVNVVEKVIRNLEPNVGRSLRGSAARVLLQDQRFTANFIIRKGFGGRGDNGMRMEYVNNIVASDYCLVTRGAGNFSYRFYEVLSCGRIPIFIDTDCVLPFDHLIDWKKHCIWVDAKNIRSIPEIVMEFHNKVSETKYEQIQKSNRLLYEEWICPLGYFKNLHKCIIPFIARPK